MRGRRRKRRGRGRGEEMDTMSCLCFRLLRRVLWHRLLEVRLCQAHRLGVEWLVFLWGFVTAASAMFCMDMDRSLDGYGTRFVCQRSIETFYITMNISHPL